MPDNYAPLTSLDSGRFPLAGQNAVTAWFRSCAYLASSSSQTLGQTAGFNTAFFVPPRPGEYQENCGYSVLPLASTCYQLRSTWDNNPTPHLKLSMLIPRPTTCPACWRKIPNTTLLHVGAQKPGQQEFLFFLRLRGPVISDIMAYN